MWSKYKFYFIGAGALVLGYLLYKKYRSSSTSAIEEESGNPASKLTNTGVSTVGDQVALMRAANYVK